MKAPLSPSFLRFLLVGGSFSLIYSLTTAALIRFAHTPAFATSVAVYLCCIPPAFLAHKHFAFAVRETRAAALPLYALAQIGSVVAISFVTTRFVTHEFWKDTALMLLTSAIAAVVNYLISRFVIFLAR